MALDDLARERQADPRPSPVILAIMQPPENLEDHVLIIFRNTDAVVAHVVMQGLARIDANLDPLIGLVIVFDGVPDEVEEDIADSLAIAKRRPEPRRPAHVNAALGQSVTKRKQSRIDNLVQIDAIERHRSFTHPRVIEKRIDQAVHSLRELEDTRDLLPAFLVKRIRLPPLQRCREMVNAMQMVLEIMSSRMGEAVEIGMGRLKLPAYPIDLLRASENEIADRNAQFENGGLFILVPWRRVVPHAFLPERER